MRDKVEVLTSMDGRHSWSQGFLDADRRWKDVPFNSMMRADEKLTGGTFRLVPSQPITARYVHYRVTNTRIFDCTELEVLDFIRADPFDRRIALPDEAGPIMSLAPADDGSENSGVPSTAPVASQR